jgi:Flp pilus assembly protein CpaB
MRPKNMILLVVAVGCGLVASYMTQQLLANRERAVPTVKLLVAKKRIPAYTAIKDPDAMFTEKEFPENVAPKKAVTSTAEAKDKRTNKVLNEEEILLVDDLADSKSEGLSVALPPGERAVAIKVNAEKSVAGFVLPGSRVDVLATLNNERTGKESRIILQNMLVLAVDNKETKDADQRSMIGQTVTLSAKIEEAQKLSLAQSLGELQLVLRPFGDNAFVHQPAVNRKDLERAPTDNSGTDPKEEETARASQQPAPVPVLPPIIQDAPEKKEVKVVEAPPPPKKVIQTHTLTILVGERQQKAVFTKEPGQKAWRNGQIGRTPEEVLDGNTTKVSAGEAPPAEAAAPAEPGAEQPRDPAKTPAPKNDK